MSEARRPNALAIGTWAIALGLLVTSGALVYLRSGALAWLGLIFAIAILVKLARRPGRADALVAVVFTLAWAAAWGVAWNYVRATWESGEVVDLTIEGPTVAHTARVWILDVEGGPVMYYDAPPDAARALLAKSPMTIDRGDIQLRGCANAAPVDAIPSEELDSLFAEMQSKYQERNQATNVFYVVLGVERDRVGLVLRLDTCA